MPPCVQPHERLGLPARSWARHLYTRNYLAHLERTGARSSTPANLYFMSLQYLKEAVGSGDNEKLIRYVRLHFGDGDEAAGRKEIDKAWIEALKLMLDLPQTERAFILEAIAGHDAATLAHLFFHLHFYFVRRSGEWIHDGEL